jgi:uncharacterized protein YbjQ (UPF0145 family)
VNSSYTDTARALLTDGKTEAAVEALWTAEASVRGNRDELEVLLELARAVKVESVSKKVSREVATLIDSLQDSISNAQSMPTMPVRPRFREGIPVSTSNEVSGWEVTDHIGEVFGLVVRSRGAFPQFGANLKAVFGGELKTMTNLLRETRQDAVRRMVEEAEARGADAVIAMRFDVTTMGDTAGWTEICAYGTAVHATKFGGR